jgi:hypothetical protein
MKAGEVARQYLAMGFVVEIDPTHVGAFGPKALRVEFAGVDDRRIKVARWKWHRHVADHGILFLGQVFR